MSKDNGQFTPQQYAQKMREANARTEAENQRMEGIKLNIRALRKIGSRFKLPPHRTHNSARARYKEPRTS